MKKTQLNEIVEIRSKILDLIKEFNKLSEETNFGSHMAVIEGNFEVDFCEQSDENEEVAWNSSPWCAGG